MLKNTRTTAVEMYSGDKSDHHNPFFDAYVDIIDRVFEKKGALIVPRYLFPTPASVLVRKPVAISNAANPSNTIITPGGGKPIPIIFATIISDSRNGLITIPTTFSTIAAPIPITLKATAGLSAGATATINSVLIYKPR